MGIPLQLSSAPVAIDDNVSRIESKMLQLKEHGCRIVLAILQEEDRYPMVKLAADRVCLPSQCVKFKNVQRPPRGYHTNVLMKINSKMGGVNQTLAPRGPPLCNEATGEVNEVFQFPPQSISWLLDDYCMVMVRTYILMCVCVYYRISYSHMSISPSNYSYVVT